MSKCIDPRGCARFHWCHCLEGRGLPHSLCKTVGRFHRCTNSNHRFHNRLDHRETRKNFLGRTEISPKGTVCIGHDPFDLGTGQNHKSCIQPLRSRWRIYQWRISFRRARWYPVGKNGPEPAPYVCLRLGSIAPSKPLCLSRPTLQINITDLNTASQTGVQPNGPTSKCVVRRLGVKNTVRLHSEIYLIQGSKAQLHHVFCGKRAKHVNARLHHEPACTVALTSGAIVSPI